MEISSIVSFHNECSKSEFTTHCTEKDVNVHELALHVMRDRCLLLQRRISSLENDNMRLKMSGMKIETYSELQDDKKFEMQHKLADLTKQKSQLMHHVLMVTYENKNLWNLLAKHKKTNRLEPTTNCSPADNTPKPHLIRTNTYIQSSSPIIETNKEKSFASLEEISLQLANSFYQEKSQLVEQYEQMNEIQSTEDLLNLDSISFAYLEEPGTDSLKELRTQTEKLLQLKKELSNQEIALMKILSHVEKMYQEDRKCSSCALKISNQITTENKEIETSDSLVEWATPVQSNSYHDPELIEITTVQKPDIKVTDEALDSFDNREKICPACGQNFTGVLNFKEFTNHVAKHFSLDSDTDPDDLSSNSDEINYLHKLSRP